jgi:hypothetical protein
MYYAKTNWKKDSVIIVPNGYQGYIPMSKSDWTTFITNFRQVERKTYKVSNLINARTANKYITENNIAAQYQVDKYDDLWGKPNIEWLKYQGFFKFKDTIKYEDLYGNKTKIKLMYQYPHKKFNVEIYTPYADLNKKEYHNIVTVFCNQDFYESFHSKTIVTKWKPFEVLISVITDDKHLSILDSILDGKTDK